MSLVPRQMSCGGCGHEWEWNENETLEHNLRDAFAHMMKHEHSEDMHVEFRSRRCREVLGGMRCMLDENHTGPHEIRWT